MNLSKPLSSVSRLIHALFLRTLSYLPRQQSVTFDSNPGAAHSKIGPVFVINLDRQPSRWIEILRELGRLSDSQGVPLSSRVVRYSACDGQDVLPELFDGSMVLPFYTLGDQLFVEPQPDAVPDEFDLERPIRMSQAEIGIARSHIGLWKTIAKSNACYSLVLEDDIRFHRGFGRILDRAWHEMAEADQGNPRFDILYVSYKEVRHGAPKDIVSANVFRPERGLWYLSGYVLSKKGAQALLELLPCSGPVDLWINQKFRKLDVRALRRSVVSQRRDLHSTNTYSILPALSKIGVLDNGKAALFHGRPIHCPVLAFGSPGSGLSSLAMALSMLGYRCCSDFESIPEVELESLLTGRADRVFDAYVNIGSLVPHIRRLLLRYPRAKFVVMDDIENPSDPHIDAILAALEGTDLLRLCSKHTDTNKWRDLCEHLKIAPPNAQYPSVDDVGLRKRQRMVPGSGMLSSSHRLRHDPSPWIAKPSKVWGGISVSPLDMDTSFGALRVRFEDDFSQIRSGRWLLRNDTFPGNLGLFRPANVKPLPDGGLSLSVIEQPLGVRNLSAAAISSCVEVQYGRFEATFQATNVPGLVTGFFLYRDSPRQEIDIEILGNRPECVLVNVFYNPGSNGAKFDYGYRGTPEIVNLGFDASKAYHEYAIEWDPCEIRWLVDRKLVRRRVVWDPTPIPHLPMTLHVNTWPTSSRELAGRLARRALPATALVRRVAASAY
jgi:GR25 family glycosyltransferase involved in LPS biosynthesis